MPSMFVTGCVDLHFKEILNLEAFRYIVNKREWPNIHSKKYMGWLYLISVRTRTGNLKIH